MVSRQQFWDMMWMDTNKKRSGAKKQSRSHSQAMSRTASEWGDAPEGEHRLYALGG